MDGAWPTAGTPQHAARGSLFYPRKRGQLPKPALHSGEGISPKLGRVWVLAREAREWAGGGRRSSAQGSRVRPSARLPVLHVLAWVM